MSKIVKVQAPDGQIIKVEGPDDASDADFIAQAELLYQPNIPTAGAPKPIPQGLTQEPQSMGKSVLDWVLNTVKEQGPAMAGGALGGAVGIPFGPPGIAAGAAFGGAGGEALRQVINRISGQPSPQTSAEAANLVAQGAATGFGQEVGAIAGPALVRAVAKPAASRLEAVAQKGMAEVLGGMTNENKAITSRIVPQMLKRRIVAMTERGLQAKAETGVEAAGAALEDALAKIPTNRKVNVAPILKALGEYKKTFQVAGSKVIGDERGSEMAQAQIEKVMEIVKEQGPDVSFQSLRSLRQILDKSVKAGKGFGGRTITEGTELDAKRELAGAIRSELAKAEPDIAKINAEYSFWKNMDQVISAKIQRQLPQSRPLGEQLLTGAGAAGGIARGGLTGGIGYGLAAKELAKTFRSTGWKTVSANGKNLVAELLSSGKTQQAAAIAGRLTGAVIGQSISRRAVEQQRR